MQAVRLVASLAKSIGGRVKLHRRSSSATFWKFASAPRAAGASPSCCSATWTPSGRSARCGRCPGASAMGDSFGPGVLDMKAGVAMALAAIRALAQLGISRPITLLLNTDEEVGSPASRPITERLALASSAVSGAGTGAGPGLQDRAQGRRRLPHRRHRRRIAQRRGLRAAATRPSWNLRGCCEKVAGFTDLRSGRTVNPGVISGGTHANVVAQHAFADVDVRIARASDAARVDRLFRSLRCADPHAS